MDASRFLWTFGAALQADELISNTAQDYRGWRAAVRVEEQESGPSKHPEAAHQIADHDRVAVVAPAIEFCTATSKNIL